MTTGSDSGAAAGAGGGTATTVTTAGGSTEVGVVMTSTGTTSDVVTSGATSATTTGGAGAPTGEECLEDAACMTGFTCEGGFCRPCPADEPCECPDGLEPRLVEINGCYVCDCFNDVPD